MNYAQAAKGAQTNKSSQQSKREQPQRHGAQKSAEIEEGNEVAKRELQIDQRIELLKRELEEKERSRRESDVKVVEFVRHSGISIHSSLATATPSLPIYAIIFSLLSLENDPKLMALRRDQVLMSGLRASIATMENSLVAVTDQTLFPTNAAPGTKPSPGFVLPAQLTKFLGFLLGYLIQKYPERLGDVLSQNRAFYHLLLLSCSSPLAHGKEDDSSISSALHALIIYDHEKGPFAAKTFAEGIFSFLEKAPCFDIRPNVLFTACSLGFLALRSLLKEGKSRHTKPDDPKSRPLASIEEFPPLLSQPAVDVIFDLLRKEGSSMEKLGCLLPFLGNLAKLEACRELVREGLEPEIISPTLHKTHAQYLLLKELASKALIGLVLKAPYLLHGTHFLHGVTCDPSVLYQDFWFQLLLTLNFQDSKPRVPPSALKIHFHFSSIVQKDEISTALLHISGHFLDILIKKETPSVLRNATTKTLSLMLFQTPPSILNKMRLGEKLGKELVAAAAEKDIKQTGHKTGKRLPHLQQLGQLLLSSCPLEPNQQILLIKGFEATQVSSNGIDPGKEREILEKEKMERARLEAQMEKDRLQKEIELERRIKELELLEKIQQLEKLSGLSQ